MSFDKFNEKCNLEDLVILMILLSLKLKAPKNYWWCWNNISAKPYTRILTGVTEMNANFFFAFV